MCTRKRHLPEFQSTYICLHSLSFYYIYYYTSPISQAHQHSKPSSGPQGRHRKHSRTSKRYLRPQIHHHIVKEGHSFLSQTQRVTDAAGMDAQSITERRPAATILSCTVQRWADLKGHASDYKPLQITATDACLPCTKKKEKKKVQLRSHSGTWTKTREDTFQGYWFLPNVNWFKPSSALAWSTQGTPCCGTPHPQISAYREIVHFKVNHRSRGYRAKTQRIYKPHVKQTVTFHSSLQFMFINWTSKINWQQGSGFPLGLWSICNPQWGECGVLDCFTHFKQK